MKVLMISVNRPAPHVHPVMPLGTGLAAAFARKAGHEVGLLDLWWEGDYRKAIAERIRHFNPSVVGISIRNTGEVENPYYPENYIEYIKNVVLRIKEAGVDNIVFGGYGFSCAPEEFLNRCGGTIGIIGEADTGWPLLLSRLGSGASLEEVPNTVLLTDGIFTYGPSERIPDLTGLVHPAWDLYDRRYFTLKTAVPCMNLQTKRGCTFRCLDCDVPAVDSPFDRLRPAGEVVDEISRIKKDLHVHSIFFADNVFNDSRKHVEAVCNELIDRKVVMPWFAFAVPHRCGEEHYSLMKASGCRMLIFEIQSASDEMLKQWGKDFKWEHIYKAARWCANINLPIIFLVQFGGPLETLWTVQESIQRLEQLKPALVKIQIPQAGLTPWGRDKSLPSRGDFVAGRIDRGAEKLIDEFHERNNHVLREIDD